MMIIPPVSDDKVSRLFAIFSELRKLQTSFRVLRPPSISLILPPWNEKMVPHSISAIALRA